MCDRWFNAPGGTAVFLSGPIVLWAYGYAITEPWILVSSGLFILFPIVGGLYWAPLARRIDAALALGDDEEAAALLRARQNVVISRLENLVLVVIIVLMVLRPDW